MIRRLRTGIFLSLAVTVALTAAPFSGQPSGGAANQRQTALALEAAGKDAEAEAAWHIYLKNHPSSPEPYAHLGLLEARQEHFKEAIPLYRKALALGPAMPALRMNLGLALYKNGDLKPAIVEFQGLLKNQQPGSVESQRLNILIATAYYGLAEYAKAVPFFKRAAASDKQNLPLLLSLAHSCLWSKQFQCVLDTYHEILLLNANSAEADMLAGEALDGLKDYYGAIQQFRDAVKANPREPNVHYELGYLLWTQKQNQEAASEFQAELANDPNHAQAMAYLADIDLQSQHPESAQPLLEKAVAINPEIEQAHLDLGILYAGAGRQQDALRELMLAEKQAPEDVNVHWRLGRLYRSMGKSDEAKAEFELASKINKNTDESLVKRVNGAQGNPAPSPSPAESTPK